MTVAHHDPQPGTVARMKKADIVARLPFVFGLDPTRHINGLRSRTWAKGGIETATQFQEEPAP